MLESISNTNCLAYATCIRQNAHINVQPLTQQTSHEVPGNISNTKKLHACKGAYCTFNLRSWVKYGHMLVTPTVFRPDGIISGAQQNCRSPLALIQQSIRLINVHLHTLPVLLLSNATKPVQNASS